MAKRKSSSSQPDESSASTPAAYTVLARRYRPRQFRELIGQEPVARALINALESGRVAHAYLFTGARGVGKTSAARILAKALNCEKGPTATPCDICDICRSIASGEDVDVLEIDGASNRGIDEVREVRQNVQYRPSRSRYKIYIIDEVHMLTPQAFNALLKTLEEPPAHVKFIFATTEVQRIPVTILSRCQRFDFAGISTALIVERLRQVVAGEKMGAEDQALELIARRAGGSMRDAQSLLDQLLAFGGDEERVLTADEVHRQLGTAQDDHVIGLATAVLERDSKKALDLLSQAAEQGLNLGELLDQVMNYWRDLMVIRCAGVEGRDLSLAPRHHSTLAAQASALSLDTILAGLDILVATKARLRGSSHGRVLMEMALVRLGRLDELVSLSQMASWLREGTAPSSTPTVKEKKVAGAERRTSERSAGYTLQSGSALLPEPPGIPQPSQGISKTPTLVIPSEQSIPQLWRDVLTQVGPILASHLEKAEVPAISGPNTLVLRFPPGYNQHCQHCQEPTSVARTEEILKKITGRVWSLRVESSGRQADPGVDPAPESENSQSRYQRQRAEAMQEPLVKRAIEVLGAQIVHMDDGFGAAPVEINDRPDTVEPEEP